MALKVHIKPLPSPCCRLQDTVGRLLPETQSRRGTVGGSEQYYHSVSLLPTPTLTMCHPI